MYSKDALRCHKCPEKHEGGCPAWTEFVEQKVGTEDTRVTKGCVFALLPHLLLYAEHSSNRVAAEMSSIRGAAADAVKNLVATAACAAIESGSGERDAV